MSNPNHHRQRFFAVVGAGIFETTEECSFWGTGTDESVTC